MFEILFLHLLKKVSLSHEEQDIIKSFFIVKKLRKRQYLLQAGDVCKYLCFVEKGLLRSYNVDDKGIEHMNMFAWEGWWTSDMYSFFTGEKAVINIDAIEDTELLMITMEGFEKMTLIVPKMDRYFRILFQNSLITKERRLISSITHTAEEKYTNLVESNPTLVQRVPQNLIASYLGLAPETLSRIKKNIALRK
ncbi:Crp/Fnr family transcriptional regulator [Mucilaginibacter psychrotolerans]|uniref:Crp/Fnr family transcriptional regulator n=1 Tax=Mucilaginibacter psychrotolerans TaxID=1524096 RepID=A0A4Y8SQJ8_9SPHI|nr:Crp/Fnr family transcriptional regulator [Mucilaginibacter psychrotolerans]TFF40797.1 Crp/Fnr family transcriptional regulator [Mucilaginibacter psychrotolerans]